MMNSNKIIKIHIIILTVFLSFIAIFSSGNNVKHRFSDRKQCLKCHRNSIPRSRKGVYCNELCISCHKMGRHHKLRVTASSKGGKLKLLNRNRIGCITCHDLSVKRFDTVPWKSSSFYDNIFNRKDQYKTYFLIENNSKGKLCKECH